MLSKQISIRSRRVSLAVALAGLTAACMPQPHPPEPVADDRWAVPAHRGDLPPGVRAVDAAMGADVPATAAAAAPPSPQQPCGLPEGLRQPDWPRTLEPTTSTEPVAFVAGTSTLAVFPDTQYYTYCKYGHLLAQRQWVEQQRATRNIRGILTLGDLTDANTSEEWQFFKEAITPLDPSLPVVLTSGNHDYGERGSANRRETWMGRYFDRSFAAPAGALVETMDEASLENAFYSIDIGRIRVGVLTLEWSPRENVVEWANAVLARHPKLRTIVITHAYLYSDDTRYDFQARHATQAWNPLAYRTAAPDAVTRTAHDGEMLWQELVKKHANVFLVLSGHVLNDGSGRLSSRGDRGNVVHQLLSNYQMLDEGGLGYLRLLEFLPDGRTLRVKTFSPSLNTFATAADQQFELPLTPPLWTGKP